MYVHVATYNDVNQCIIMCKHCLYCAHARTNKIRILILSHKRVGVECRSWAGGRYIIIRGSNFHMWSYSYQLRRPAAVDVVDVHVAGESGRLRGVSERRS